MTRKQQDWWTRMVLRAAKNGIGGEKFEAL
jgi:hypothetical protein